MRKYFYIGLAILIALMAIGLIVTITSYKSLQAKYEISTANEKSLQARLNNADDEIIVYQADIDNLRNSKNSVIQELMITKDKLKIKDKQIQLLANTTTQYYKSDTVRLTDTIFRETSFSMDTLLGDRWWHTSLYMEYPSTIRVATTMMSNKDVFIFTSRETIDPPKSFFLCRWFQRKHTVTKVVIDEKNPYIISNQSVFIKTTD